jgi:beta-galactosidase
LYITSRRFTKRAEAITDVKVYSNASEVELLVDGVSQGKRSDGENCVFIWRAVRLQPGENRIEARATRDGQTLSDACSWTLTPEKSGGKEH